MNWSFTLWVSPGLLLATYASWQIRRCWLRVLKSEDASMVGVMLSILLNRESQEVATSDDQRASRWDPELQRARLAYLTLVAWMAIGCLLFWGRLW